MKIELYTDPSGFSALAEEWNPLLRRSASDTIFLTWEWQRCWWEHLGEGELILVAVRDDEDTLIGIAPLFAARDEEGRAVLAFVGGVDLSDYLDLIAARGHEEALYAALLDLLGEGGAIRWDVAEFCNIPAASPTRRFLPALARARGYRAHVAVQEICPVISLPATWEAYLSSLSKKERHEIRRKIRKAHREAQITWYIVQDPARLPGEVEEFIELHRKSAEEKEAFMAPRVQGFFRAIARVLHRRGWLQLAFIEVNGEKAATVLCFDYGDAILVYNSGYDPQRYADLSPGMVLLSHCLEHAIQQGRKRFDFLRGEEEYKFRFGAQETKVHRLLIEK
jgi:CelD/BcsL family acetyltransferase involved in cellulose biosynthesis